MKQKSEIKIPENTHSVLNFRGHQLPGNAEQWTVDDVQQFFLKKI